MKSTVCALFILVAASTAAQQSQAPAVASVNGIAITQSAYDRALQAAIALGMPDTPALRTTVKDQLVARELFRQQAEKGGFQNDPEVRAAVEEARANAMVQRYLRATIKPKPVTDADVRAQYDAIVASLGEREYKARLIQVATEDLARSLAAQIKSSAASFESLARQFSTAPNAPAGGALEWLSFKMPVQEGRTQGLPVPIAEAMTRLAPGMVTADPIAAGGLWYLVKLDAVRPTVVPDFQAARTPLRQMLEAREMEQATAALVATLLRNARIQ